MKIANIDREILHIYDLRNLNEIFWKDVTFDKIKSQKTGFYHLFRRYIFRKITGAGGSNWPPTPTILGLRNFPSFRTAIFRNTYQWLLPKQKNDSYSDRKYWPCMARDNRMPILWIYILVSILLATRPEIGKTISRSC